MTHRILVVDDEPERLNDLREEIRFSFRGQDIQVVEAADVPGAKRVFERQGPFDVVVLDLHLPMYAGPEEGGVHLLREFASRSPHTVYILSSGSPPEGEHAQNHLPSGLPSGNFYRIPKTEPRQRLVTQIRNILARKAGTAAPQAAKAV
jgi:CheY-like chemotaxis protein